MRNLNKLKILNPELENKIKEMIRLYYNKNRYDLQKHYGDLLKQVSDKINNIRSLEELDLEEFVKPNGICEGIAIGMDFKKSQFRKFYNEIKNIKIKINKLHKEQDTSELISIAIKIISLIPKLAYSKGRGLIDNNFFKFMKVIIGKLREKLNKENFDVFDKILESILAYHTYYNPKEN